MQDCCRIHPDDIYDDAAIMMALETTPGVLANARKRGELRAGRLGQHWYYRGAWVLEWLEAAAARAERRTVDD